MKIAVTVCRRPPRCEDSPLDLGAAFHDWGRGPRRARLGSQILQPWLSSPCCKRAARERPRDVTGPLPGRTLSNPTRPPAVDWRPLGGRHWRTGRRWLPRACAARAPATVFEKGARLVGHGVALLHPCSIFCPSHLRDATHGSRAQALRALHALAPHASHASMLTLQAQGTGPRVQAPTRQRQPQ